MIKNDLIIIGNKAVNMILDNIKNKIDDKGNEFAPYSFPYWVWKYKRNTIKYKKILKKNYRNWNAINFALKGEFGAEYEIKKKNVDMFLSGSMVADLGVLSVDKINDGYRITVGASQRHNVLKIFYHNISGAGKSRVVRRFLYLSKSQEEELAQIAKVFAIQGKWEIEDFLKNLKIE